MLKGNNLLKGVSYYMKMVNVNKLQRLASGIQTERAHDRPETVEVGSNALAGTGILR